MAARCPAPASPARSCGPAPGSGRGDAGPPRPAPRRVEAFGGVLPDRLQQSVAHLPVVAGHGDHEGLVDQGAEQKGDARGFHDDAVGGGGQGADLLGGGQRAASGEDGEAAQHGAFGGVQQVPGPVDDGAQGLLAGQRGAAAVAEEAEAVVETVGDLARGEHPQPGGGQFDGERQPVQPAADLGAGGGGRLVRVDTETGAGGGTAFGEQAQCHGVRQGFDGAHELARHAEGFAAGGQDGQPGAAGEEVVGEGGGGPDDVLAVVQQDQHPARGAVLGEPYEGVGGRAVGGPQLLRPRPAEHGLAGAERAEYGLGHGVRVVHGGQLHQPDPVGPVPRDGLRRLLGQPRLARPAGAEQGDEPGTGEVLAQGGHVRVPPDETGEPGAEVAGRGRGQGRGWGRRRRACGGGRGNGRVGGRGGWRVDGRGGPWGLAGPGS